MNPDDAPLLNPWKGSDPESSEQLQIWASDDAANAELWGPQPVAKGLSRNFGSKSRRRAQLVSRLKRSRSYADPVRGGTGKQSRTRRRKF